MSMQGLRTSPFSVTELTMEIKELLESHIPQIWIAGEITGFRPARSGHWYFSLKDDRTQIRVNMWRSTTRRIDFQPKEGDHVLIYGPVNLYTPRGEYSLIAEWMEPLGKGRMRMDFERMKAMLMQEGLFESSHKKKLPPFPRRVGVITSKSGAALQDILNVLHRRFRGLTVVVADSKVQGEGAAEDLVKAMNNLDQHGNCDVIIIGRGGGSEEDLQAFNDETLTRTIFKAQTPVISAVGHETDFSLTDFVADVRAATPSQAAELVVKSGEELRAILLSLQTRLLSRVQSHLHHASQRLHNLHAEAVFSRLKRSCDDRFQTIDILREQIQWKMEQHLSKARVSLRHLDDHLAQDRQSLDLSRKKLHIEDIIRHLSLQIKRHLEVREAQYSKTTHTLEALSPLKILARGYSLIQDENGKIISASDDVQHGQRLKARLHKGSLNIQVMD